MMELGPPVAWKLFQAYKKEGFTESQAFDLCSEYVKAMMPKLEYKGTPCPD